MALKFFFVIFVMYCALFVQVMGQDEPGCRPDSVQAVIVTADMRVIWAPPENNTCIEHYLIYIWDETDTVLTFTVAGRYYLELDFLPICESFYFSVTPVSPEGILGPTMETYAKTYYPIDEDLRIELFMASVRDQGAYLEWKVAEEFQNCPERFRLTVVDTFTDEPVDLYYSTNSAFINGLIPCASYIFGIRAIYNLGLEGSYISTRFQAAAFNISPPTLESVTLGSTSVVLTWELERYTLNRCSISSLNIDGSPYFAISYPVSDQVNRPPIRTELTGLQPDTMYLLNVTSGTSAPTLVTIQTLQN